MGRSRRAGLDVYEGEPALNPAYITLENVVLLPHLGSATAVTRDAMGNMVLDGIDAVLAGREPREPGALGPWNDDAAVSFCITVPSIRCRS